MESETISMEACVCVCVFGGANDAFNRTALHSEPSSLSRTAGRLGNASV